MKVKVPKKLTAIIVSFFTAVIPLGIDELGNKLKERSEKKEQEKLYENQKHNGMVKYASIVFSLVSLTLSILAIKQFNFILFAVGILSVTAFVISFLYCLEIIKENRHNVYKIFFLIGDMLMLITAILLFF